MPPLVVIGLTELPLAAALNGNMYMTYPTVRHLEKFLKNCATAEKRLYFECVS